MWPFVSRATLGGSGVFRGFTDWHSHILPGVDDGVRTLEESLETLRLYGGAGVREVWLTPHVMEDCPNGTAALRERFSELLSAYEGGVALRLASENMLDALFVERLESGDLLPLGGRGDHLLVETSFFNPPVGLDDLLRRVCSRGYRPVLAHPERYAYMGMRDYRRLRGLGVRFQLNLPSLAGFYGAAVRGKAEALLEAGMYDLTGTDTHSPDLLRRLLVSPVRKRTVREIVPEYRSRHSKYEALDCREI